MADLRVEDVILAKVQATFRTGASRLGPVIWAVKGLNGEVVGADPLAQRLGDAGSVLADELGIMGQAMTELASRVVQIGATFGDVDQALGREARAIR